MILYIRFGHLSKFSILYNKSDELQMMVDRWTGIKWRIKDKIYINDIVCILSRNGIKYDIA